MHGDEQVACFITPLATGLLVELLKRYVKTWRGRLSLLSKMLLGGSFILALEHVWHGEVVPYPPFLTAMSNPADIPVMLGEMAVVGTSMVLATVATWAIVLHVGAKLKTTVEPAKPVSTTLGAR